MRVAAVTAFLQQYSTRDRHITRFFPRGTGHSGWLHLAVSWGADEAPPDGAKWYLSVQCGDGSGKLPDCAPEPHWVPAMLSSEVTPEGQRTLAVPRVSTSSTRMPRPKLVVGRRRGGGPTGTLCYLQVAMLAPGASAAKRFVVQAAGDKGPVSFELINAKKFAKKRKVEELAVDVAPPAAPRSVNPRPATPPEVGIFLESPTQLVPEYRGRDGMVYDVLPQFGTLSFPVKFGLEHLRGRRLYMLLQFVEGDADLTAAASSTTASVPKPKHWIDAELADRGDGTQVVSIVRKSPSNRKLPRPKMPRGRHSTMPGCIARLCVAAVAPQQPVAMVYPVLCHAARGIVPATTRIINIKREYASAQVDAKDEEDRLPRSLRLRAQATAAAAKSEDVNMSMLAVDDGEGGDDDDDDDEGTGELSYPSDQDEGDDIEDQADIDDDDLHIEAHVAAEAEGLDDELMSLGTWSHHSGGRRSLALSGPSGTQLTTSTGLSVGSLRSLLYSVDMAAAGSGSGAGAGVAAAASPAAAAAAASAVAPHDVPVPAAAEGSVAGSGSLGSIPGVLLETFDMLPEELGDGRPLADIMADEAADGSASMATHGQRSVFSKLLHRGPASQHGMALSAYSEQGPLTVGILDFRGPRGRHAPSGEAEVAVLQSWAVSGSDSHMRPLKVTIIPLLDGAVTAESVSASLRLCGQLNVLHVIGVGAVDSRGEFAVRHGSSVLSCVELCSAIRQYEEHVQPPQLILMNVCGVDPDRLRGRGVQATSIIGHTGELMAEVGPAFTALFYLHVRQGMPVSAAFQSTLRELRDCLEGSDRACLAQYTINSISEVVRMPAIDARTAEFIDFERYDDHHDTSPGSGMVHVAQPSPKVKWWPFALLAVLASALLIVVIILAATSPDSESSHICSQAEFTSAPRVISAWPSLTARAQGTSISFLAESNQDNRIVTTQCTVVQTLGGGAASTGTCSVSCGGADSGGECWLHLPDIDQWATSVDVQAQLTIVGLDAWCTGFDFVLQATMPVRGTS